MEALLKILENDVEVQTLLKQANILTINRLGYNDHGPVHAKIVTENALKLLDLLLKADIKPNIIKESLGDVEDVKNVVVLSAYLHDIGCSINRDRHGVHGTYLAIPIAKRILMDLYNDEKKVYSLLPIVLEGILCHLGNFKPSCLEAGLIAVADGTDITEGRARIPFRIGKRDIHEYSSIAIKSVEIKKGEKKPIRIEVRMTSTAGVFQVEKILLDKIMKSKLDKHIEVVSIIKTEKKEYRDVYLE
jgi:metal-dependent HD superfamily phosphatase/phosphodiesterase